MSRLGEQNAPGFAAFEQAMKTAHETAHVEVTTLSKSKYVVARGAIEFDNGVIKFTNLDQIVIIPWTSIDHVTFRKP